MIIQIRQPQYFTEVGRKDNQEDFLWPNPQNVGINQRIFIMCDGVGGQDCGEIASETAATALGIYLTSHRPKDGYITVSLFNEALNYAYDELDKKDTGALSKMGTTMTCVVLHRGGALVAHIGDSRIYHIRPSLADVGKGRSGIIYQSADHSLVNDLLRAGEITEKEAINFPQKNVITRAMQPHRERRSRADIYNLDDILDGDYFFLCCDGVLEQLTNEKLGEILSEKTLDDSGKIAAIKSICDSKTKDNYTCWLVPIDKVTRENTDVVEQSEVQAVVVNSKHPKEAEKTTLEHRPNKRNDSTPTKRKSQSLFLLSIIAVIIAGFWLGKSFYSSNGAYLDSIHCTVSSDTIAQRQKDTADNTAIEPKKDSVQTKETTKVVEPVKAKTEVPTIPKEKPQVNEKPEVVNEVQDSSKANKQSILIDINHKKENPDGQP